MRANLNSISYTRFCYTYQTGKDRYSDLIVNLIKYIKVIFGSNQEKSRLSVRKVDFLDLSSMENWILCLVKEILKPNSGLSVKVRRET